MSKVCVCGVVVTVCVCVVWCCDVSLLHTSGQPDKMVDALSVLKQRATADDPTALFTLVSDLGKVGKDEGGKGAGRAHAPHHIMGSIHVPHLTWTECVPHTVSECRVLRAYVTWHCMCAAVGRCCYSVGAGCT